MVVIFATREPSINRLEATKDEGQESKSPQNSSNRFDHERNLLSQPHDFLLYEMNSDETWRKNREIFIQEVEKFEVLDQYRATDLRHSRCPPKFELGLPE